MTIARMGLKIKDRSRFSIGLASIVTRSVWRFSSYNVCVSVVRINTEVY